MLDGWNVRLELDGGTGSVLAANTHAGLDRLLVRDQAGTSLFLHTDGLNSTTALTDAQGQVLERYRYAAFGKVEVLNADGTPKTGNAPAQPFTFTGREWEPESGLFFYRNRFYSASMGRFINRDPSGEAGGINLYAYVENSSVNATDAMGLDGGGVWPDGFDPAPPGGLPRVAIVEGAAGYFTGLGYGVYHQGRLYGLDGEAAQKQSQIEHQILSAALLEGGAYAAKHPGKVADGIVDYVSDHPGLVIGRMGTGAAVGMLLNTRLGFPFGSLIGVELSAFSGYGSAMTSIHNGVEFTKENILPSVLGVPCK